MLATNVAETSLTVPGIRYVVDAGTARISRYSQRTKVQRLPIEPVCRPAPTSARAGAARVADGICIRLYSEDDYDGPARVHRPRDPAHQPRLGHPPDDRARARRHRRASRSSTRPTPARSPTASGCSRSCRPSTPRTTSRDGTGARDAAHGIRAAARRGCRRPAARPDGDRGRTGWGACARCSSSSPPCRSRTRASGRRTSRRRRTQRTRGSRDEHSRLRRAAQPVGATSRSSRRRCPRSAFRRMCKRRVPALPAHPRVAGPAQPAAAGVPSSVGLDAPARRPLPRASRTPTRSTSALLAGLLSHVGAPRRGEAGLPRRARRAVRHLARARRCSASSRSSSWPAELVETTRLWARGQRPDRPGLGRAARPRTSSSAATREPRWSAQAGRGRGDRAGHALRRAARRRPHRRLRAGRPGASPGDLFIRHALVEGDWDTHHAFFRDNRGPVERLARARGSARGGATSSSTTRTLIAFYDERIPADVVSARHFDRWWKKARRQTPDLLTFTEDLLLRDERRRGRRRGPPEDLAAGRRSSLPVTYQFEPGAAADGVTVHIPVERAQPGDRRRASTGRCPGCARSSSPP